MPIDLIPFNRPFLAGNEHEYLRQAVESGRLSGDGSFTQRASALLENTLGVKKVLLTTSCTHALDMSALLLDLQPGDEVIVPAFTFVSTVNAFVLRGARPVFADIRPDTLNLDEERLESLVSERTKAIVPVHYAGVGCNMEAILAVARRHNLWVVEDNAHGLFGTYHSQYLGTFGALAAQSFHETKNFTCGEGGALLINNPALVERAEIIREKGTNRSRFFRGQVDKYTWVDVGSSYLPSEMLAAFLLAQLEAREEIQRRRQGIWQRYDTELAEWAENNGVRRPIIPAAAGQAYHMYYLLFPGLAERTAFIQTMKERGLMCVFHYLPLHLSPMGLGFGGQAGNCPVTESVSDRLVRLPFFTGMTAEEQARVIGAVQQAG